MSAKSVQSFYRERTTIFKRRQTLPILKLVGSKYDTRIRLSLWCELVCSVCLHVNGVIWSRVCGLWTGGAEPSLWEWNSQLTGLFSLKVKGVQSWCDGLLQCVQIRRVPVCMMWCRLYYWNFVVSSPTPASEMQYEYETLRARDLKRDYCKDTFPWTEAVAEMVVPSRAARAHLTVIEPWSLARPCHLSKMTRCYR